MGKARKIKQARGMQRSKQEAYALEAQHAKTPCKSCAFSDPEAFISNPGMAWALLRCLTKPQAHSFFCHSGYPPEVRLDGTLGSYQVPRLPDGRPDTSKLEPCGGFLRWAVKFRLASYWVQFKAVMALQLKMCRRYLASDEGADFRASCGGRADILQRALNLSSLSHHEED